MPEQEVRSLLYVAPAPRSALVNPCHQARAVIHHVDAPTLFPRGRHMERAATARSRGSRTVRHSSLSWPEHTQPMAYPACAQSAPFLREEHLDRVHVEIGLQWLRLPDRGHLRPCPNFPRKVATHVDCRRHHKLFSAAGNCNIEQPALFLQRRSGLL